ncbi:hypothetical protein C8R43DRAFT_1111618 [Mycena crocata]|nr:hypothetical protein C8R43DRAFT_1111618 [Mycena crocata]
MLPAVVHLRSTVENAISKLGSAAVLPDVVQNYLDGAHSFIYDSDLQPADRLVAEYGCGRPHFSLAILAALLRVLPDSYRTRVFLYGLLPVFLAESSLDTLAQHLQSKTREDFSHGELLLMIIGVIFKQYWQDQSKVQHFVGTVLDGVFKEIRQAAAYLVQRDQVLAEIRSRCRTSTSSPLVRMLPDPRAEALKDVPRLLLENIRRSSQGFGPHELLKFRCTPEGGGYIIKRQKRQRTKTDSNKSDNKRRKKDPPPSTPAKQRAQDAYVARQLRRKAKQSKLHKSGNGKDPFMKRNTTDVSIEDPSSSLFENPGHSRVAKAAIESPLSNSTDGYPNNIEAELQLEIEVLFLAPDDDLRLRHGKRFYIKAPAIPDHHWTTVPVEDIKKSEGLLVIGHWVFEAALSKMIHEARYALPLTYELVLACLMSDRTLQTILVQGGVFHEMETVPAHYPAKALKVYIGAAFIAGQLSFGFDSWMNRIFGSIVQSLKTRNWAGGVDVYARNKAALAAIRDKSL